MQRKANLQSVPNLRFYIIGNITSSSSFNEVCLSESWCSSQSTLFSEGKTRCNTKKAVCKSDWARNLRGRGYIAWNYICALSKAKANLHPRAVPSVPQKSLGQNINVSAQTGFFYLSHRTDLCSCAVPFPRSACLPKCWKTLRVTRMTLFSKIHLYFIR